MPFANKFRATMEMPLPGDTVGTFVVESVDVEHHGDGAGRYSYPVRMMLRGPGGQAGVRKALRPLLSSHPTTFSGYGNPYQLWFGKPEVVSLGDKRYEVTVEGAGARVYLDEELGRFLAHLADAGHLTSGATDDDGGLVDEYLAEYEAKVRRQVGRYTGRLRRADARASSDDRSADGTEGD